MSTPLLSTEHMVTYLVGDAPSGVRYLAARILYNLAREGKIHNYGGPVKHGALWNPGEVLAQGVGYVLPYDQEQAVMP